MGVPRQWCNISHHRTCASVAFRCGACKRLKEDFEANGEKLLELADSFLMINVGGDDNNKFDVREFSRFPAYFWW